MLSSKLTFKSSLNFNISKQMHESLKILQMNGNELNEYVVNQVQENPFLEIIQNDDYSYNSSNDEELINHWQNDNYQIYDKSKNDLSNIASQSITLREHLLNQINLVFKDQSHKQIAYNLVDLLDGNGYLKISNEEFNISSIKFNYIIKKLKTLDPTGIFAEDLQDCLLIQLSQSKYDSPLMRDIINNIDSVYNNKSKQKLLKRLKISVSMFENCIDIIRRFDPKPALKFTSFTIQSKFFDAIVFKNVLTCQFEAKLNEEAYTNIYINNDLFDRIATNFKSKDDKKFCITHLRNANWLYKSLLKRAQTILDVTQAIIKFQNEFLIFGQKYLKPMKLSDIASLINVSESTVSRVSNKFIQTPYGIFEIKYFFSNSFNSTCSENTYSSHYIKNEILWVVEKELQSKEVLTDGMILQHLKLKGINISRRTVAKYRQKLKIGSSHSRRIIT